MSNFQTNTVLHANSFVKKDQKEDNGEAKQEGRKVPTGTVFMGPLSHREESVDTILRSQASGVWSDEMEEQYMQSVRTKATAKVRAMLLQAKRRSDEIIAEGELAAQHVIDQAHAMHAQVLEQQAQIQGQFDEAYHLGSQKAMEDVQNILEQNQKALGESTAVVLLSIHQQLQKFYDVWREELRQLTLEAIKVGSGWVGDGKKEEILADMLDECVRRMVEKTQYTVRVHPSDGALVSQVLENSKEQAWSMETSKDLEPGSLELEGSHSIVKNQSGDRKRFVQEILDELVLPKKPEEAQIVQNVTDTLMEEMTQNPLLAQNTNNLAPQTNEQEQMQNISALPEEHETGEKLATNEFPDEFPDEQAMNIHAPEDMQNKDMQNGQMDNSHAMQDFENANNVENIPHNNAQQNELAQVENVPEPLATETHAPENNAIEEQNTAEPSMQRPTDSTPEAVANIPAENTGKKVGAPSTSPIELPNTNTPQIDPNAEAQNLVDSFLADDKEELKEAIKEEVNTEAEAKPAPKKIKTRVPRRATKQAPPKAPEHNTLPTNIADDLLSEMGFGDDAAQ